MLRLLSICKSIGGNIVLNNIDLDIGSGDIIVVRGRSGVGKTTLAKIASLLLKPDKGSIEFMNKDITSLNNSMISYLRLRYIGYIDQMFRLIPYISVYENIELPLKMIGIPKNKRRKKILDIASLLGIDDKLYRYPDELSGGEKQRAVIVRAIAKEPKLIVGDEPTSNLDDYTAQNIVKIFREIANDKDIAILITTTDFYQDFAQDKDLLLSNGRLYTVNK